jgi:hypothetical protein
MDRFERLLAGDVTDVERALLDSASDDAPSARARKRTLAAMGVGAGVAVGAAHAAHAATQVAASGVAKSVGSVSMLVILKWIGTGALVGSIVAAGVATVTTPGLVFSRHAAQVAPAITSFAPAPEAFAKATPARSATDAPLPSEATANAPKAAPTPIVAGRAERASVPAPTDPAPAEAPPAVAPATTVASEVASLDRARAALSAGNAREALARLAAYDSSFPHGTLEPEAVVLRVRALVSLGDAPQAKRVAERFIAAHPDSAQAGRLESLVGHR